MQTRVLYCVWRESESGLYGLVAPSNANATPGTHSRREKKTMRGLHTELGCAATQEHPSEAVAKWFVVFAVGTGLWCGGMGRQNGEGLLSLRTLGCRQSCW